MIDIDIISTSIAIGAMVAFAIPFYVNHLKVKKAKLNKESLLKGFIKSHGLTINMQDQWRSQYFIGLDTQQRTLVYIDDLEEIKPILIDFNEVKQVRINEISRSLKSKGPDRKIIDGLYLELLNPQGKVIESLEFFHGDKFSDLVGEPVLIKKWEAILKSTLKNTTENKSLVI
ncbi:hypothetical protein MM239_14315 [Belliella sp. DSM 111904]|uniref:Uncharacterized protein n=1 Tax=Belliella filtrata TaxID=2923435 RepID=A0ABS9V2H6_9BACT|nr:hypothetical protein [Belliella filtrata]MCH7410578.1 hypothetical protein [Belliella filtrata]